MTQNLIQIIRVLSLLIVFTLVTVIIARLAGGNKPNEGRLEISVNDGADWGTVCDDQWDIHDATVACHQLGFPSATHAGTSAEFGQGAGDILLDDVNCDGTEQGLAYCDHAGVGIHNCGHAEDASVTCEPRGEWITNAQEISHNSLEMSQKWCTQTSAIFHVANICA